MNRKSDAFFRSTRIAKVEVEEFQTASICAVVMVTAQNGDAYVLSFYSKETADEVAEGYRQRGEIDDECTIFNRVN